MVDMGSLYLSDIINRAGLNPKKVKFIGAFFVSCTGIVKLCTPWRGRLLPFVKKYRYR